MQLDELYQAVILDHNHNPQNFGVLTDADSAAEGYNANCGDNITIYLKFDGDRIADVQFSGDGCAISKASASLMTLAIKGLTLIRARQMAEEMLELLSGKQSLPENSEALGDRIALLGVRHFPMRIKCATLPWHALLQAMVKK